MTLDHVVEFIGVGEALSRPYELPRWGGVLYTKGVRMKLKGFLNQVASVVLIALVLVGCGAPAAGNSSSSGQPAAADEYVLASIDCIVSHSSWRGTVVAPGVTKPTSGTITAFECNGKEVALASDTITDGYIETRDFGKVGIRFASQVQTVGAGEYMDLAEGISLPEPAVEVYVLNSMLKDIDRYSK